GSLRRGQNYTGSRHARQQHDSTEIPAGRPCRESVSSRSNKLTYSSAGRSFQTDLTLIVAAPFRAGPMLTFVDIIGGKQSCLPGRSAPIVEELAKHVREDASVLIVANLLGGVDSDRN